MNEKKVRIITVYSICILLLTTILIGGTIWFWTNKKYASNIYHYNPQFIPGDIKAENNIINQSMRGLLEMFEDHPNWKFSIEFSGYGLEIIHERFPDVFALFKKLNVDTKQLELILSPYSDQLSVAYPHADIIKAVEISHKIAANYELIPSRVLFLQESQWLEDSYLLADYYDYYVVRKEAFDYYFPDIEGNRVYSYTGPNRGEIRVIPGDYFPNIDFSETWVVTYLGDGEATNTDSYGNYFQLKQEEQDQYEETLRQFESFGFQIATVREAAEASEARKPEKSLNIFDNMPDSFWSMTSTIGAYRWMGDNSYPKTMPAKWYPYLTQDLTCSENDGELLAKNYRTRNYLLMVQEVYELYSGSLHSTDKNLYNNYMEQAWKNLILGEVSDSTGWSPYYIEIEYTLDHADIARDYATKALNLIKTRTGKTQFKVNVYDKVVDASNFTDISLSSIDQENAIILPKIQGSSEYEILLQEAKWYDFNFQALSIIINITNLSQFDIVFEDLGNWIAYCSALLPDQYHFLYRNNFAKDIIFSGSNGFFYSKDKGTAIIKKCEQRHTACHFGNESLIWKEQGFNEQWINNWSISTVSYEFYLYQGTASKALELANRINTYPQGII